MAEHESKAKRIPKGAKLPSSPLGEVEAIARAFSELAAPSSPARIASQIGMTVSGLFKRRLAAAKYYGIVRKEGQKLAITDRGEAFLKGDADSKRAAVMGTGFGPIISTFSSKRVNEDAIEARLQDDWSVPEGSAPDLRKVLVESAEDAGLISDGKFDPAAIESVSEDQLEAPEKPPNRAEKSTHKNAGKSVHHEGTSGSGKVEEPVSSKGRSRSSALDAPPIQVLVRIDAGSLDPVQLAELIRELQKSAGSTG
jgi:hypothetical protein